MEQSSSEASYKVPFDINNYYEPKIKGNGVNDEFVKDFYNFVGDQANVGCVEWYMDGWDVDVKNVEKLVAKTMPKFGNTKQCF
ncbi:hypothetical protein MKX03_010280 [Papaver bracteatum]|nr:hypothetical protein MKX03_010280 [Papaver bracteatum]